MDETKTKTSANTDFGEVVAKIPIEAARVKAILGIDDEVEKYTRCWDVEKYRRDSKNGERCIEMFLEVVDDIFGEIEEGHSLIDYGCGTGRAGYELYEKTNFDVTLMDFAPNCLDEHVREACYDYEQDRIQFIRHDISKPHNRAANFGFCTDVMEHLPPERVDDALRHILGACDFAFFQIDMQPCYWGDHPDIQAELHLTVWDYGRWLKTFADHGVVIHRSMEKAGKAIFMVSGYEGFAYNKVKVNTPDQVVYKHIHYNLSKDLKQLRPFQEQPDQKVIVLGGGPSLNNFVDEIKEHKANGAKIVTVNGTYNWAEKHGLWPVTQFMLDARPFNKRFVEPVDEQNLYMMCSQVDPQTIDILPPDRTWLFQSNLDNTSVALCNELVGEMYEDWFPVCGGSSIMLRTLPALFMMGFRDVEVYGFDSCFMGTSVGEDEDFHDFRALNLQHHAYIQEENDIADKGDHANRVAALTVAGKRFIVEGWMLCQAKEFIESRRRLLGGMNLVVHGDGLIAHCLANNLDAIDD